VDTAPACPFVAFEDDREARASSPDHRHRCYAELVPSPRAAAHQEAYCLSSAFPVCPTFQDWARREAAHARGEGERPRSAPRAVPEEAPDEPTPEGDEDLDPDYRPPRQVLPPDVPPIRRNPPRDWAAPPPWAPGGTGARPSGASTRSTGGDSDAPGFLAERDSESRGLVGSAADRLAAGSTSSLDEPIALRRHEAESAPPDEELAGLVAGRHPAERPGTEYPASRTGRRPTVSSTRPRADRDRERERDAIVGPSWEHSRRFEAYPTIRSRAGMPAIPRLVVLAGALVIAAVALFYLPALLGVGGGDPDTPTASPSSSEVIASQSVEPATPAAPTQQVYVVKENDTMSKIAAAFGITLDELCQANSEAIPDCDKIAIGDEIIIPAGAPEEFTEPSASPEAS
jgi:hypothetical protein